MVVTKLACEAYLDQDLTLVPSLQPLDGPRRFKGREYVFMRSVGEAALRRLSNGQTPLPGSVHVVDYRLP